MNAVFADTFYWVALANTHDATHERALAPPPSLGSPRIVTTEHVITEYLNFFAEWSEHFRRKAADNVQDMLFRRSVTIVPHTHQSSVEAFAFYRLCPDKCYSLTDCVSMETMRREGLTDALTNDRHSGRKDSGPVPGFLKDHTRDGL